MPTPITSQPWALTTTQRIKDQLGISVTSFDDVITRYIAAATDFIENATTRRFLRTTYTQEIYDGSFLDGSRKTMLVLNNAPLVSISDYAYRTGSKTNPVWTTMLADNYQEKLDSAVIMGHVPAGFQNIRISYVAGYLIDFTNEYDVTKHNLPHDISDLCERLVCRRFKKRESEGKSIESFAQSSITWGKLVDDLDNAIIADYQRFILN